jgi:hypothetical protein
MPVLSQQLWGQYLSLLPTEKEMSCLLNYGPSESHWLQHPRLIVGDMLRLGVEGFTPILHRQTRSLPFLAHADWCYSPAYNMI